MALSLDTISSAESNVAALPRTTSAMPPEYPLEMPTQSLRHWSAAEERLPVARHLNRTPWLARLFVFGGALLLTAYGAQEMYQVVSVSRTTVLQWLLLALFTVNFSWIAVAFTSAVLGFFVLLRRAKPPAGLPSVLKSRTAVVMPVYNEQTARTFAALEAISESVEATGLGSSFDYFILSDLDRSGRLGFGRASLSRPARPARTRGPPLLSPSSEEDHHRKAGNIADWVSRWGGHYDHMLVLDADSLMTGECIVRLAAAMEADRTPDHPVAAAHHQPQHVFRPAAAIRGGCTGR